MTLPQEDLRRRAGEVANPAPVVQMWGDGNIGYHAGQT